MTTAPQVTTSTDIDLKVSAKSAALVTIVGVTWLILLAILTAV